MSVDGDGIGGLSGRDTIYEPSVNASPVNLTEGELFDDRYRVVKALGAGGMGAAYLAKDELTEEEIVLKIIHPSLVDEQAKQRMIAEGVNTRKIKHANVVTVHDVKDSNGQMYLAMEYVKGQPLRQWMASNMAAGLDSSLKDVVQIILETLSGLEAAHNARVIHRDLKPDNIMLEGVPGEDDFKLKIIDFGIATGLKNSATTTTTMAIGAPQYMAPEQMTMPDAVRPSADIFSVGRMFYELLMEVLPDGMWDAPSNTRSDIPVALDSVIQKALQRPKVRFQSAAEFADAIKLSVGDLGGEEYVPEPKKPEPKKPEIKPKKTSNSLSKPIWLGLGLLVLVSIVINQLNGPGIELPPPPPPPDVSEWKLYDSNNNFNIFTMMFDEDGYASGSGVIQSIGFVTLSGYPNEYLEVYNTSGEYIADIYGEFVPSPTVSGANDYNAEVIRSSQRIGTLVFHIDH